jgi:hypothetical protein
MRELDLFALQNAKDNHERALMLSKLGVSVVPIKHKSKTPVVREWKSCKTAVPSADKIGEWFLNKVRNYSIVTGEVSGLVAVDCDSEDAIAYVDENFEITPFMVSSRPGRRHSYYRLPPNVKIGNRVKIFIEGAKQEIDIRGSGGLIVGPGSTHEVGTIYKIVSPLKKINLDELPYLPTTLVDLVQKKSTESYKSEILNTLKIEEKIKLVVDKLEMLGPAIEGQGGDIHTFKAACIARLECALPEDLALKVLFDWNRNCQPPWTEDQLLQKIRNASEYGSGAFAYEWEPIIPIDSSNLPSFPMNSLPLWMKEYVMAVTNFMEVPADMAAIFAMGAINAATAGRFKISVNSGYEETNVLWLAVVLGPGNRKTGAMNMFFDFLKKHENSLIEKFKLELPKILTKNEVIELQIKNLKQSLKKKSAQSTEELESEILRLKCQLSKRILPPQLLVGDITSEALAEVMENNSERCAMVSDEGGIFDIIAGRYSNQIPNFDIYLQAYSGSSVKVNRRTQEKIICLTNPALSITLSPQPVVISQLLETPIFRRRGFIGRFLLSVPNSPVGKRKIENPPIPTEIKSKYEDRMNAIVAGITFIKEPF